MEKIFQYSIDEAFGYSVADLKGIRKYYVEGYASTVDKDKAGEIISSDAQKEIYNQLINQNITLDLEHQEWYSEDGTVLPRPKNQMIPVAKVVDARLDDNGVWIKAELNQNISKFQEVWGSIREGFLKAFSIAFYPVERVGHIVKSLQLVNITLTGSPVNPNATFSATMKSAAAYLDTIKNTVEETHQITVNSDNSSTDVSIKSEENKMADEKEKKEYECDKCEKEFDSKEALDKHKETHEKGEGDEEAGKKAEVEKVPEEAEVKKCHGGLKAEFDVEAEIKAIKESHEAELKSLREQLDAVTKAHSDEVATLKAELAKPVMKAVISEVPEIKAEMVYRTPLNLLG